ncbi:TIGR02530 family flagellar biosynthesis protein [Clostridiaceae bacterium HSG29]|nr:TIGR02530 family flagellar biosynthesis protein [Clostridiaceae bacterium HSG29]
MTKISNEYVLNRNRINGIDDSKKNVQTNKVSNGKSFKEIMNQLSKNEKVNFSKHALQRLEKRNINLTSEDVDKITNAVNIAKAKGVKDALIIMGDNAFVTSIKNNMVITATSGTDLKESVFTNIDGAVII